MRPSFSRIATGFAIIAGLAGCARVELPLPPARAPEAGIVPRPLEFTAAAGRFVLSPGMPIIVPSVNGEAAAVAAYLAQRLEAAYGLDLPIAEASGPLPSPAVSLAIAADDGLGSEGYRLAVDPSGIAVSAAGPAGLFYGIQTILQLLPARAAAASLPCVRVMDRPRFGWRGVLLDCSRHFFGPGDVKNVIEAMAQHKMNTFHWHLTDDQGWRVEIKRFPRLAEIGAWRVDREARPWNAREPQKPGERATYGGFYTQAEIREIVDFARSRFVTIVPEIEMPGHCLSALAAYPELSCAGGPFTVPPGGVWPIKDVFCPGNDRTFSFLEGVLDEVLELFPGEFIHIGGDEVDKSTWKTCPRCQARIKAEGLKNEDELQSWFIRRIEGYLNAKGRRLIGWDEILEGGLAPNATVMSWRGVQGGIAAAKSGHDVVMTPTSHCYFDYYQGDPAREPLAIGGFLPLSRVYSFEPVPAELTADEARRVLGCQANLWTEYIADAGHAEYMLFPRLAAMAETAWTPRELKAWDDFLGRLGALLPRYEAAGLSYARSMFAVKATPSLDPAGGICTIKLETESLRPEIRYTLDGKPPSASSRLYDAPVALTKSAVLKAAAFEAGKAIGAPAEARFTAHLAVGRPVALAERYRDRYSGGGDRALVDGLHATKSQTDPGWQGYEGVDLQATIDLGEARPVGRGEAGFFRSSAAWIFLPESLEFAVSEDGREFRAVARLENDVPADAAEPMIKTYAASWPPVRARYVRVSAKSIGVCPPGHPGAGGKAWLFADEIVVGRR